MELHQRHMRSRPEMSKGMCCSGQCSRMGRVMDLLLLPESRPRHPEKVELLLLYALLGRLITNQRVRCVARVNTVC